MRATFTTEVDDGIGAVALVVTYEARDDEEVDLIDVTYENGVAVEGDMFDEELIEQCDARKYDDLAAERADAADYIYQQRREAAWFD